jgi:putative glutamine amidotransferase
VTRSSHGGTHEDEHPGRRVVIAVVAYELPQAATPDRPAGHVAISERYVQSLHRAGARVLMLPAITGAPRCPPEELLAGADGILLIGGGDLDPSTYGQDAHPTSYGFNALRDELELEIARYALASGIPILAICRGCQVVNVAQGGTLHQHVSENPGYDDDLHGRPHDMFLGEHAVEIEAGSHLAAAVGSERVSRCTSAHHQSVDVIGTGLRVTGWAADGCVEAIEPVAPHPFALAVQWHPEMTAEDDPAQQALFDALVAAAGARRDRFPDDLMDVNAGPV